MLTPCIPTAGQGSFGEGYLSALRIPTNKSRWKVSFMSLKSDRVISQLLFCKTLPSSCHTVSFNETLCNTPRDPEFAPSIVSENLISGFAFAKLLLREAICLPMLLPLAGGLARCPLPVCTRGHAVSGNMLDFKTQPSSASVFSAGEVN